MVKKNLLMETAFQFELESKLSTGRERFASFLHSGDVRVSQPAPTQSRYFKSFSKSQNSLT